jgi:hypothetical protein
MTNVSSAHDPTLIAVWGGARREIHLGIPMKTARLIARFLHLKAAALRRHYYLDCLLSMSISLGTLIFQFACYAAFLWYWTGFASSPAVEIVIFAALLLIAFQFVFYAAYGNIYREPTSALEASPPFRLLFAGFFLIGPQTFMDAVHAFKKAARIGSIDFENCAKVLHLLMKAPEEVTWQQVWEVISVRQSVNIIAEELRLFPGVIVQPTHLKLASGLRIEIADFCRQEKERIHDAAAASELGDG